MPQSAVYFYPVSEPEYLKGFLLKSLERLCDMHYRVHRQGEFDFSLVSPDGDVVGIALVESVINIHRHRTELTDLLEGDYLYRNDDHMKVGVLLGMLCFPSDESKGPSGFTSSVHESVFLGVCKDWIHVNYVYIKPSLRGAGLGQLFLHAVCEILSPASIITLIPENEDLRLTKYWKSKGYASLRGDRQTLSQFSEYILFREHISVDFAECEEGVLSGGYEQCLRDMVRERSKRRGVPEATLYRQLEAREYDSWG